jgi:uncharacterized RDD family membrane protein YckC
MKSAAGRTLVDVLTPEGIPLRFEVAGAGDRTGAFLLDALIIFAVLMVTGLLAQIGDGGMWIQAALMLLAFVLRTFYFTFFELRWQGRTPGKKKSGLRVMDRHGGPLTAEAVVVRNLTRELELFVPLIFLLAPESFWPDASGWVRLAASLWILAVGFLPFFGPLRLRVGDLVAGTMVVVAPTVQLLPDKGEAEAQAATYHFTEAQLDIYGIYELQVLEDVLRQADKGADGWLAGQAVAEKIQAKIQYAAAGRIDVQVFLRDFYAALRARLEHRMLLGERKQDKYAAQKKPRR